jgi:hypothetical protein
VENDGARVGMSASLAIDFSFEPIPERFVLGQRGAPDIRRRHHARSKLADDLLPQLRMIAHGREIQAFQGKVGRLRAAVVARDTVLVEEGAFGGG